MASMTFAPERHQTIALGPRTEFRVPRRQARGLPGSVPQPREAIEPNSGIVQLPAGDNGHVLAPRSEGTVLAWGGNVAGQHGTGGTASHTGPVRVSGLANASQVSAGNSFSLAVYLPPPTATQ
jgi:hypothetical protein